MPRRGGLLPVEITSHERCVPTEAVWHGTRTIRETRLLDAWRKGAARQIEVRPASIVEETTQLIEVVHHADVRGLAVRVAGAAAVRQLTVVSPLVHERARLHERGAAWLTFGIAECAQRYEDVGAGIVGDAGLVGGTWKSGLSRRGASQRSVVPWSRPALRLHRGTACRTSGARWRGRRGHSGTCRDGCDRTSARMYSPAHRTGRPGREPLAARSAPHHAGSGSRSSSQPCRDSRRTGTPTADRSALANRQSPAR